MSHHLFPYLSHNDLLRIRRVCKATLPLANDYIRLHGKTSTELRIASFTDNHFDRETNSYHNCPSMKDLLEMEAPVVTTCFRFWPVVRPDINVFGDHWNVLEFAERFGNQITHLTINGLSAPLQKFEKEMAFFEKLPNLTHLVIENLVMDNKQLKKCGNLYDFPSTFENIRNIAVKAYHISADNYKTRKYLMEMIVACHNVEHIGHPEYILRSHDGTPTEVDVKGFDEADDKSLAFTPYMFANVKMLHMYRLAMQRQDKDSPVIKTYDLACLDEDHSQIYGGVGSPEFFIPFCEFCATFGIKVVNVPADMLSCFETDPQNNVFRHADTCITSLIGLNVDCIQANLHLLDKISLETGLKTTLRNPESGIRWDMLGIPVWPQLTTIELTVNSAKLIDKTPVTILFHLLFSVPRPTVTDLKLKLEPECTLEGEEYLTENLRVIPTPKPRMIITSCENLKKLTIENWNGTNKGISMLWSALLQLEEVTLENCQALGNNAFVGEDTENPTFLKLQSEHFYFEVIKMCMHLSFLSISRVSVNFWYSFYFDCIDLKKLSLKCLEAMPKITDTAFLLIFRHVRLIEFNLICSRPKYPLKSVKKTN